MFQREPDELPYFDGTGNEYVTEILKQDAFVKRGGKLSASQMIKYENRVAMLTERLLLILDAVKEDQEALRDYLQSIEETCRAGRLPRQVYLRFQEKLHKAEEDSAHRFERDRDRHRVLGARTKEDQPNLSELSVDQLLDLHRRRAISNDVLFQQFQEREKAGIRLQRMDPRLWSRYRNWIAESRPNRK